MSPFPCWEMLCPSPGHRQPLDGWFLPGREGGMEDVLQALCEGRREFLVAPYLHVSVSFALVLCLTQQEVTSAALLVPVGTSMTGLLCRLCLSPGSFVKGPSCAGRPGEPHGASGLSTTLPRSAGSWTARNVFPKLPELVGCHPSGVGGV